MKNLFLFSLIILLFANCQTDKDPLEGSWILAGQSDGSVFTGTLLHFENDEVALSHIYDNENRTFPYFIENNEIRIDSNLWGEIRHLSADSLILQDSFYRFVFLPLMETNFSKKDKFTLENSLSKHVWSFNHDTQNYRFYFDTIPLHELDKEFLNSDSKYMICATETKEDSTIYNHLDESFWKVKYFKNKLLFSFGRSVDFKFFQFENTDFFDKNLIGNSFIDDEYEFSKNELPQKNLFKKEKSLPQKEHDNLKSQLTGSWKSSKFISPLEIFDYHEHEPELGLRFGRRTARKGFDFISIEDLQNLNLQFDFNANGSYSITAGNKQIHKGDFWDITVDGKYIYLNHKINRVEFIEIKSLKDNRLVIRKIDELRKAENVERNYIGYERLELELTR